MQRKLLRVALLRGIYKVPPTPTGNHKDRDMVNCLKKGHDYLSNGDKQHMFTTFLLLVT